VALNIEPEQRDIVLYKTWYSAFQANLRDSIQGVDTVVWAGVSTDCCILASAFDADRLELHSVIPIEAVSASSCEVFSASLTALGKSVATVVSVDAILAGQDISDPEIAVVDIPGQAEKWFKGQEARLSAVGSGSSLSEVLQLLGDAA